MADHKASDCSGVAEPRSPLMLPTQVANILAIPLRRLYAWKSEGKGPKFVQGGRNIRYRESDLVEYIESNIVDPSEASSDK